MSESRPHKPSLIVFAHGFGSADDCWDKLRDRLKEDGRVTPLFDFEFFQYRTRKIALGEELPTLSDLAEELAAFLREKKARGYRDITLVGHSMGGLVIQTYIKATLEAGRGDELAPLRQVILFATPSLGSVKYDIPRRFLSLLLPNPQEERLRVFDPEVSSTQTHLADRVVDAMGRTAKEFPIPFVCFYGEDDDIVPEPSVRGRFDYVIGLPGDHSSVIRPTHLGDPRYVPFVEHLLQPAGHRNFFEVEEWGVSVRVEPRDPAVPVMAVHGRTRREVRSDNYAHLTRSIKFSRRNRCRAPFVLSYKTLNKEGWVDYTTSHENEIGPQVKRDYKGDGYNAVFEFTPRVAEDGGPAPDAGETYCLDVDIYRGFDEGRRDLHFHLSDYDCVYHRIFFHLDLSAYLSAGYEVTDEPQFYLGDDPGDCEACNESDLGEARPPKKRDPRGVWEWEIDGAREGVVRDGVINVKWDVAQKSG